MIDQFRGQYRFLSNFYPALVEYDGMYYPTSEHAYQAAKTYDIIIRGQVALLSTPKDAKRFGRTIQKIDGWNVLRVGIMLEIVRSKFNDISLARLLLSTDGHKLVEGNSWGDTFWGECGGKGENMLGEILMLVRYELKIRKGIYGERI